MLCLLFGMLKHAEISSPNRSNYNLNALFFCFQGTLWYGSGLTHHPTYITNWTSCGPLKGKIEGGNRFIKKNFCQRQKQKRHTIIYIVVLPTLLQKEKTTTTITCQMSNGFGPKYLKMERKMKKTILLLLLYV